MHKQVLIIDDDNRNIFALTAILKARGYNTIAFGSTEEAFANLEKNPAISVILMDMMMPGMDGYEAIPRLKQHDRYKEIPVIAVTAQAMPGDREKCLAAGADDYLSKPVDIDRLAGLLQKYLQ